MAQVKLRHVTKKYDNNIVAVKSADIEIQDKEFVVLVGPSGCGKSTLLRMIAGLEEITSGELRIDDALVNDVAPKDRNIAMVFQNYALYPHMSVFDNMAFGLKLRKFPKDDIQMRVREAADILGIAHLLDRKPKALSGGQRQRVAVGRAIVRKPKVFLFDEPLSNLDAKLRVQMRAEISKLHTQLKTTMIYVTHDQVEAMTMGDRIVVMREGRIQQIDSPLNLYNQPANMFVAGFIGSPSMNFIKGRLLQNGTLAFQSKGMNLKIAGPDMEVLQKYVDSDVVMGIRPENIYWSDGAHAAVDGIEAFVEVIEPMGNETFLHARSGKKLITARIAPQAKATVGQMCLLGLDMSKAHFFDKKTGAKIGRIKGNI